MDERHIPRLRLGQVESRLPIIQGGMGVGISLSGLASAVANAGGIGVISAAGAGMLTPGFGSDFIEANRAALRQEIRKARAATSGPIGVNIMIAMTDHIGLLRVALEEKVDAVFLGAGLPMKTLKELPAQLFEQARTAFVPIVSSARAFRLITRYWCKAFGRVPDAAVVEGPKAGGHLGFSRGQLDDPAYSLPNLVSETVEAAREYEEEAGRPIPVIAAGGIFDGDDIHRALSLGASGVQMATRFVATEECDADPRFKQAYVDCDSEDLTIIDSPVGLPGRALRNGFLSRVSEGRTAPLRCPWHCLLTCRQSASPYCIAKALIQAKLGRLEHGFAFAGSNAFRIDRIVSVKSLMTTLEHELIRAFRRVAALTPAPAASLP